MLYNTTVIELDTNGNPLRRWVGQEEADLAAYAAAKASAYLFTGEVGAITVDRA